MNPFRIYDKAIRVIASCLTVEHLSMCSAFTNLALKRLEEIGTGFSKEAYWDIRYRLVQKEAEFAPKHTPQPMGVNWGMIARMRQQVAADHPLMQSLWPSF